jgi:hypothetical protein
MAYSLLHIFSIFGPKSSFKGLTFRRLVQFCDKENQLGIIINNVKNVETLSKEWNLSQQDRRELYKSCSHILDKNNE